MKKKIRFLVLALTLSANMMLCACGGKVTTETDQYVENEVSDNKENGSGGEKESAEETKEGDKAVDPDKRTGDAKLDSIIEQIEEKGKKERESISSQMQAMVSGITDFDSYIDNKDRIKEGYDEMLCTLNDLYASLEEELLQYCITYKQDDTYQDYTDQSKALMVIYNVMNYELSECYNTANTEFSGAYTVFNDIFTDAYNNIDYGLPMEKWSSLYEDYSNEWNGMYEDYTEAWNKMYEDYSNAWSIMYAQYSAAYGTLFDDNKDIETLFREAKADYLKEKDLDTETQKEEETKEDTPKEDTIKEEKPKEDKPKEDTPKEETKPEPEKEEEKDKDKETTNKGIRPEFQQAMDEYVEFFEEYCAFLKKYSETDDIMSLYNDYLKYMQQYADTMEAFDKLGEEEMSDEEMKLYLKTMDEINKMLLSVY